MVTNDRILNGRGAYMGSRTHRTVSPTESSCPFDRSLLSPLASPSNRLSPRAILPFNYGLNYPPIPPLSFSRTRRGEELSNQL